VTPRPLAALAGALLLAACGGDDGPAPSATQTPPVAIEGVPEVPPPPVVPPDAPARVRGGTPADWVRRLGEKTDAARIEAARALGEAGPAAKAAVPALVESMRNASVEVRAAASDAIAKIGDVSVPRLVESLKDGDARLRAGAAEALGKLGSSAQEAVPALESAATDARDEVRLAAEKALRAIRGR
jgi:hypothetical protein